MIVKAGRISSPHGLDGSVKVAEAVPVLLRKGAEVRVGGRTVRIERRSGTDAKPIIRVSGCADRDAAEALRGVVIEVDRADAPELGADEWWSADLIGLAVRDGGHDVGTVTGVLGLPSCEALEVERPSQSSLLVPVIGDAVRSVDLEAGVIDVDLRFLGEEPAR